MRTALRLLLVCFLLFAGASALRASIPKNRVGDFFSLAADPHPDFALQVPELRLDNPALYGETASGRTFWTNFDPEGLRTEKQSDPTKGPGGGGGSGPTYGGMPSTGPQGLGSFRSGGSSMPQTGGRAAGRTAGRTAGSGKAAPKTNSPAPKPKPKNDSTSKSGDGKVDNSSRGQNKKTQDEVKKEQVPKGQDSSSVNNSPAPQLSPSAEPQRIQGPWTKSDLQRAQNGQGPLDLAPTTNRAGKRVPLELHHADNMPGSAVHEVPPFHSKIPGAHPNKYNQGVTPNMRTKDTQLHWQMRGQEMGNPPPGT